MQEANNKGSHDVSFYLYKTYRISKSVNMEIDQWLLKAEAAEGGGN